MTGNGAAFDIWGVCNSQMRTPSLKPHAVTIFTPPPKNEKHRTDGVDFPPEAEQRIVGKGNELMESQTGCP